MYMKRILIIAVLLCNVTVANCQEQQDTIRNVELPVAIIKDSKSNIINEASTKKMDKSVLKRTNQAQDLPYLLNSISSVVTSSDAGTGTGYTGIRIRGADLTRINVSINGVPVNDPESQATYFVNTPDLLSSTQQLEVNKGVGSSKNGVGSFGASIAINNLDVNYTKPYFTYQSDFGSFNTIKNVMKASTGLINNRLVSTVRISSLLSDGYIDRSASNLKAMQWTSKYLFSPSTQLVFNYMKGKEKTGQAWNGVPQDSLATNRTYNELGIKADGSFFNNQTDNYGQDYYQLFFDTKLNNNWSLGSTLFYTKGKGYYEEYKLNQSYSDYNIDNPIIGIDTLTSTDLIRQLWLDNDFYGGRLYANYLSSKFDAGIFFNYNQYKGKHYGEVVWAQNAIPNQYRWYNLTAQKNELNVYGMIDYRFNKKFSCFADLQIRNVAYTLNGFRKNPTIQHDLNYLFFNPKTKLTYKLAKHNFSLTAGIAQKEPNRDDIEAGIDSLPKPEKLYNVELNYVYTPIKEFGIITNLFYMQYKDQLVLTGKINDVGAYTRTNIPNSFRRGIEFEVFWKPSFKILEMSGNIALSQNKIKSFTEYIDDYDNGGQIQNTYNETDIAFSPSVIIGGRISIFPLKKMKSNSFSNLSLDLLPKYVGKQYLDNTSNENRTIKSYSNLDLVLNAPFKSTKNYALNFRFGIYNYLNQLYENNGYTFSYLYGNTLTTQNYYYPQSGRRFMAGIGVEF